MLYSDTFNNSFFTFIFKKMKGKKNGKYINKNETGIH